MQPHICICTDKYKYLSRDISHETNTRPTGDRTKHHSSPNDKEYVGLEMWSQFDNVPDVLDIFSYMEPPFIYHEMC